MVDEVREYYDSMAEVEWDKLNNPYSTIEFRSTLYLIDKYFPKEGSILDIGSGPGRYSLELIKRGFDTHLLDISIKELEIAKTKIEEAGLKAGNYYCRSALELEIFEDETYDGILIMGPLYHLHHREDRLRVIKDVYRILKKGGIALFSYINTWGCLRAGVSEFPEVFEDLEHFERYIKGDLKFSPEESFTATYFTTPKLAMNEIEDGGFNIISYAGAEGFLSGMGKQLSDLSISLPGIYDNFVQKAVEYCELPQYRDATEHVHFIVKK